MEDEVARGEGFGDGGVQVAACGGGELGECGVGVLGGGRNVDDLIALFIDDLEEAGANIAKTKTIREGRDLTTILSQKS